MREGGTYAVQDRWGNEQSFVFSSAETLSWAIKLNQLGGPADHPGRRALIGAWLGPGGALDLSDRAGDPFTVVDEASGEVVLEGALGEPREAAEAGESLLQVDLSALTEPGRYHLEVPGVGRSWSFELGDDALGEAFYVHARGLYHNRCAPLEAEITPWARGDIHVVHQGGFPPDDDDYDDHADEGWGILDGGGGWVSLSHFDVVEATATDTVLPVTGGWHDAGDYDRRPQHLGVVEDLLVAWELAPASFSDGQLDLPESGNGRPDLVDEALFGLSMWRSAQAADGGVGTWVEATSHPKEADPGLDTQPYYLSLATRDSSLAYAREAARAARLLAAMGDPEAEDWLESALRAWDFALDPAAHPARSFTVDGEALRFVERPEADAERRLWAAIELRLATGDPVWDDVLLDLEGTYRSAVGNLWWQQRFARVADVVLHEDELPAGWGETARDALLEQAEVWLAAEEGNDYPWAWYDDTHAYHTLWGWGQGRWRPLVDLTLAWRLTGDERYRTGALLGVDGLLGLNPQGRVDTTGLGQHRAVTALHLPSWADDIDEPSPGIPLYGALPSVAWQASQRVWGYEEGARSSPDFDGAAISLLPPPWSADTSIDEVDAALEATLPLLRREVLLEASRPEEMEFAVFDSTSPAVLVTGLLLGPGWTPGAELRGRGPLDAAALRQDLWATP
jgi:endoglucanase